MMNKIVNFNCKEDLMKYYFFDLTKLNKKAIKIARRSVKRKNKKLTKKELLFFNDLEKKLNTWNWNIRRAENKKYGENFNLFCKNLAHYQKKIKKIKNFWKYDEYLTSNGKFLFYKNKLKNNSIIWYAKDADYALQNKLFEKWWNKINNKIKNKNLINLEKKLKIFEIMAKL